MLRDSPYETLLSQSSLSYMLASTFLHPSSPHLTFQPHVVCSLLSGQAQVPSSAYVLTCAYSKLLYLANAYSSLNSLHPLLCEGFPSRTGLTTAPLYWITVPFHCAIITGSYVYYVLKTMSSQKTKTMSKIVFGS